MPLLQPILPLLRLLALHRIPVVRQRNQDVQPNFLRKLHDLVQTLKSVLALVERKLAVLDELEPDRAVVRNFGDVWWVGGKKKKRGLGPVLRTAPTFGNRNAYR